MKKIVNILSGLLLLSVIILAVFAKSNEMIINYGNLERNHCRAFMIPEKKEVEDPEALFMVLLDTAVDTDSNIIRAFFKEGEKEGKYTLCKYILFGNEFSNYIADCKLESGTAISPDDTRDIDYSCFLSTMKTDDNDQIGHLYSHMIGIDLNIYPLGRSYDDFKTSGLYYVELGENTDYDSFIKALSSNMEQLCGLDLPTDTYEAKSPDSFVPYADTTIYLIILLALALFWGITVLYYILRSNTEISILKMMGIRRRRILIKLFTLPLCILFILAVVSSAVFAFVFEVSYAAAIFQKCFPAICSMIIYCIIAFLVSDKTSDFSQALKGKKRTRGVLLLQILVEVIFLFLVISNSESIYIHIKEANRKLENNKNWELASDYGVFCPVMIGSDLTKEEEIAKDITIGGKLYSEINKMGALYIDAGDYEDGFIELNGDPDYDCCAYVNPNYLDCFHWYDIDGNMITVTEDEKDALFIVPDSMRSIEGEIIEYYSDILESDYEYEKACGIDDPMPVPDIRIIWAATGQQLFSFNENVSMDITDPIIYVMTENNSYITSRVGSFGNGYSDPRKMPIAGSSKETYKSLEPLLKECGLDDNFTRLVSINNLNTEEVAVLRFMTIKLIIENILSALIVFFILYQSTVLVFDKNKKDYCIKNMFGLSKRKIYGSYILLKVLLIFLIASVYGLLLSHGNLIFSLWVGFAMSAIQIILILAFMDMQERKHQTEILKGL
ncbi:DUF1430 domain-containing protein [Butyrivibrio sp. MC2013]|uniref:DUF1430 domain-containing protein n=1 Tax=Butyrivibrio sp. MC2013 TaxID=1280686 RepID=UPI0004167989|nr:DUF1430 domain-containing protein [Butyrivibrio sp. MC2013]